MKIWIIGGTTDSKYLVRTIFFDKNLVNDSFDYVVSVTTPEAQSLYCEQHKVSVGKMSQAQMEQFCLDNEVAAIVDASHPFATEVSRNAIAISDALNLPYVRYEREELTTNNLCPNSEGQNLSLESFEQLLAGDYLDNHRVLLTVGCQILPKFRAWQDRATLFARILPKIDSLKMALDSGFSSDRLIALRPPYSEEFEVALWQKWQISLVVTKASGQAGGEELKRKVANSLNIPLITINRPKLVYPQITTKISAVIALLEKLSEGKLKA